MLKLFCMATQKDSPRSHPSIDLYYFHLTNSSFSKRQKYLLSILSTRLDFITGMLIIRLLKKLRSRKDRITVSNSTDAIVFDKNNEIVSPSAWAIHWERIMSAVMWDKILQLRRWLWLLTTHTHKSLIFRRRSVIP